MEWKYEKPRAGAKFAHRGPGTPIRGIGEKTVGKRGSIAVLFGKRSCVDGERVCCFRF